MGRLALAEGLGATLLSAAVIGSGIMAQRLAGGSAAIALLANTGATVAMLAVLIAALGPISGAHFNPLVSLVKWRVRELSAGQLTAYVTAQFAGCIAGAILAHAMFGLQLLQVGSRVRSGPAQWLSELVATAGLILVVQSCASAQEAAWRVPAWIAAAYWFTASTSFANPAITLARALSDTFAGIRLQDAPAFAAAQIAGALVGASLHRALQPDRLDLT
jgi:glycerol uptake facilitator-like aquaporin